jgi:hypothetical protein
VGQNGRIAFSADGISWNKTGTPLGTTHRDIAWGGIAGEEKFVAVGESGKMAYSTNGETWVEIKPSPFDKNIINIAWGGKVGEEKFVAGGNNGNMAYSANGIDWTSIPAENRSGMGTSMIDGIAWGSIGTTEMFVAVGGLGKMVYSEDGIIWTTINAKPVGSDSIADIAWGNGTFVVVTTKGRMAYSGSDIQTWTVISGGSASSPGPSTFGNAGIRGIAWGGIAGQEIFVAGSLGGKMAYSDTGTTWTAISAGTGDGTNNFDLTNIAGITWGGGKFIAVGSDGKMTYCVMEDDD